MSIDVVDLADEELHARIIERDARALAEWIRRDEGGMSRFIRSICSDRLLAVVEVEDLRQEVATTALTSLETAPLETYTTQQWLQELARRRVVDAHRFHFQAQRRDAGRQQSMHAAAGDERDGIEGLLAASFTSASAKFSRDVRSERLRLAIEQLGDDARNAIQLRYGEGLPTKEIAERLGKSDASVRVLLSRSLRQLENELRDVRPHRG